MVTPAQIAQKRKELDELQSKAGAVASEPVPQRRFGSGVTSKDQQVVLEKRKEAKVVIKEIEKQRVDLKREEAQNQKREKLKQDIERAEDVLASKDPRAIFALSGAQKKIFRKLQAQRKAGITRQIKEAEAEGLEFVGFDKQGNLLFKNDTTEQAGTSFKFEVTKKEISERKEIKKDPAPKPKSRGREFVEDISTPFKTVSSFVIGRVTDVINPTKGGLKGTATPQQKQVKETIAKAGEKIIKITVEKTGQTAEFILPPLKEIRQEKGRAQLSLDKEFVVIKQNVTSFEKRFGGKSLTPKESEQASKEATNIQTQIRSFESRQGFEERKLQEKRGKFERTPAAFIGGIITGFVTSPLDVIKLTTGVITKPKKTVVESVSSFKSLPKEVVLQPFTTTGTLTGSLIGQTLIFGGVSKVIRNIRVEISPGFREVTTIKGRKAISTPEVSGVSEIIISKPITQRQTPLPVQVRLAGTEVKAVSLQTGFIKGAKTTIGAGEKGLGLFFDPLGQLRVSRITQGQLPGNLKSLLESDIGFAKGRTQALIGKLPVEAFPKNLRTVRAKFLSGGTLTTKETIAFGEFIRTPSQQLKPIGFIGKEPEVTLPPGEILIAQRVGGSRFKGEPIDLFRINIEGQRPLKSGEIEVKLPRLDSLTSGTSRAPQTLFVSPSRNVLKGLSVSSAPSSSLNLSSLLSSIRFSGSSRPKSSISGIGRGVSSKISISRSPLSSSGSVSPSRSPINAFSSLSSTGGGSSIVLLPPETKISKLSFTKKERKKEEGRLPSSFFTFVIRGGQRVFIPGTRPKGKALRAGSTRTQRTLAAQFGIIPTGKRARQRDITFEPSKDIFREFKIRSGKNIPTPNIFIQKRPKRLGTRSERRGIQVARRL